MAAPPARSPWDAYEAKTWDAELDAFPLPGGELEEREVEVLDKFGLPKLDAAGKPVKERKKVPKRMKITFRESGDAGALVDLSFGTGGDKNQAVASLVTSSVINPPLSIMQFNSLSLLCKLALFREIVTKAKADEVADFQLGQPSGPKPEAGPTTPDGGSGAPQKPSVSVIPAN